MFSVIPVVDRDQEFESMSGRNTLFTKESMKIRTSPHLKKTLTVREIMSSVSIGIAASLRSGLSACLVSVLWRC